MKKALSFLKYVFNSLIFVIKNKDKNMQTLTDFQAIVDSINASTSKIGDILKAQATQIENAGSLSATDQTTLFSGLSSAAQTLAALVPAPAAAPEAATTTAEPTTPASTDATPQ